MQTSFFDRICIVKVQSVRHGTHAQQTRRPYRPKLAVENALRILSFFIFPHRPHFRFFPFSLLRWVPETTAKFTCVWLLPSPKSHLKTLPDLASSCPRIVLSSVQPCHHVGDMTTRRSKTDILSPGANKTKERKTKSQFHDRRLFHPTGPA